MDTKQSGRKRRKYWLFIPHQQFLHFSVLLETHRVSTFVYKISLSRLVYAQPEKRAALLSAPRMTAISDADIMTLDRSNLHMEILPTQKSTSDEEYNTEMLGTANYGAHPSNMLHRCEALRRHVLRFAESKKATAEKSDNLILDPSPPSHPTFRIL